MKYFAIGLLLSSVSASFLSEHAMSEIMAYNEIAENKVDLSEPTLKKDLKAEDNRSAADDKLAEANSKVVEAADMASADLDPSNKYDNEKYFSKMTLYHWKMLTNEEQLTLYKEATYKKNELVDQIIKQ